ncbi:hypothetical protein MNBD_ALPHA02-854 [hydrothermal vent metagenome]|uniref:Uncharacterized protein n=1 Tax=hydrothermal vent metagenome TaxID=652676 RepID=A0A3B0REB4_9ZZZZ
MADKITPSSLGREEVDNIRQITLSNISREIIKLSDFIEGNISCLSDAFMALANGSKEPEESINQMIYTLQFQDRARQNMQAISAALDIILKLSGPVKDLNPTAKKNHALMTALAKDAPQEGLDQNYLLEIFTGVIDTGAEEPSCPSETVLF